MEMQSQNKLSDRMPSRFNLRLENKTIVISHEIQGHNDFILIKTMDQFQQLESLKMSFEELPQAFQHVCYSIADFYDYLKCNEEKVIKITHQGLEVRQVRIKGNKTRDNVHNARYIPLIKNLPLCKIGKDVHSSRAQRIQEEPRVYCRGYQKQESPDQQKRKKVNKERQREERRKEREDQQCKQCLEKDKETHEMQSENKRLKNFVRGLKAQNENLNEEIKKVKMERNMEKKKSQMAEGNKEIQKSKQENDFHTVDLNSFARQLPSNQQLLSNLRSSFLIDPAGPFNSNFNFRSNNTIVERLPGKSSASYKLFGRPKQLQKNQYFAVQILAGAIGFGICLGGFRNSDLKKDFWFDTQSKKLVHNSQVKRQYSETIKINDAIVIFIYASERVIQFQHNKSQVIYRGNIPEEYLQAKEVYPFVILDQKAKFRII